MVRCLSNTWRRKVHEIDAQGENKMSSITQYLTEAPGVSTDISTCEAPTKRAEVDKIQWETEMKGSFEVALQPLLVEDRNTPGVGAGGAPTTTR